MNERARGALIKAALGGVKQIKGALTDGMDGRCALGVLLGEVGLQEPVESYGEYELRFLAPLGMTDREGAYIQFANDYKGWDFLTIARKFENGIPEEVKITKA